VSVKIDEESKTFLPEYANIPIAFKVSLIFDVTVTDNDVSRIVLTEHALEHPYLKDYDTIESPVSWPNRFDMTNWAIFAARTEDQVVGGAIVAFDTPGLEMLEDRRDLALLWDLRVSPVVRNQGVGSALFRAAQNWARERGCQRLQVETQNINVPACRFYASQGCAIGSVDRSAYPELADEIQLIWHKDL